MKLFYGPGACSMGIHLLMEEIGEPYEAVKIDLRAGETQKPPFIELNPKGKVPTLQLDDGEVVTEYPVLAQFLAKSYPAAGLMPADAKAERVAAETTDYCVATVHMQGFARLFRPANFTPTEADQEKVKDRGREMIEKSYGLLNTALEGKQWVAGDFSYADSALFYVEYWGAKRMNMQLPPNLAAHLERMLARPAVQRMLEQEGLSA